MSMLKTILSAADHTKLYLRLLRHEQLSPALSRLLTNDDATSACEIVEALSKQYMSHCAIMSKAVYEHSPQHMQKAKDYALHGHEQVQQQYMYHHMQQPHNNNQNSQSSGGHQGQLHINRGNNMAYFSSSQPVIFHHNGSANQGGNNFLTQNA